MVGREGYLTVIKDRIQLFSTHLIVATFWLFKSFSSPLYKLVFVLIWAVFIDTVHDTSLFGLRGLLKRSCPNHMD